MPRTNMGLNDNLPDGCTVNDLPGNRPEDVAYQLALESLDVAEIAREVSGYLDSAWDETLEEIPGYVEHKGGEFTLGDGDRADLRKAVLALLVWPESLLDALRPIFAKELLTAVVKVVTPC